MKKGNQGRVGKHHPKQDGAEGDLQNKTTKQWVEEKFWKNKENKGAIDIVEEDKGRGDRF